MSDRQFKFDKIAEKDFGEVTLLAKENGGNENMSEAFLRHWYLDNPSGAYAIWKVNEADRIEGFATTNNFSFKIHNQVVKVAMPQNVLTSGRVRGMGLFNKLYNHTHQQNINENGVTAFLTFTNDMSTPIFLGKFGYVKAKCPDVFFLLPRLTAGSPGVRYKVLPSVNEIPKQFINEKLAPDNALMKDAQYYTWRYGQYSSNELFVLEVKNRQEVIGYIILKRVQRKKVPFLVLMDMIFVEKANYPILMNTSRKFAASKFHAGVLAYNLADLPYNPGSFSKQFQHRFNFLVKGLSDEETTSLAETDFNLWFGDMDIF
ncbi:MAG: hypothetical protein ABIT96_12135 [Ferruginibacter sp.]